MSLTYSRRKEISESMVSSASAKDYLDKIENTVRMIYDGNSNYEKLCDSIKLIDQILDIYMESVLYTELPDRIDLFKRAEVLKSQMTEIPDDIHRQKEYAPGAMLQLDVEEEKDYVITPEGSKVTGNGGNNLIVSSE